MNGALLNSSRQDPGDARAWPEPSAPALVCCGGKNDHVSAIASHRGGEEVIARREEPGRSLPESQLSGPHAVTAEHTPARTVHSLQAGPCCTSWARQCSAQRWNQPTAPPKLVHDQSNFITTFGNAVLATSYFWDTETSSNLGPDTTAKMCKRCWNRLTGNQTF